MVESVGDPQGDLMLIPHLTVKSGLSLAVSDCFWQFSVLIAVFRWSG